MAGLVERLRVIRDKRTTTPADGRVITEAMTALTPAPQADKARGEVEREVRYWLDNLPNAIRVREGAGDECLAKSFAVNIAALTTPQPQGDASPLEKRIADELTARQSQCGVSGCTNQATHTWSGHPTCDDCGTPGRTKLDVPVVHVATPQVSGGGESVAGYIDRLGERIRQGMADVRRFGINGSHALYMDRLADEAIEYAANLSTPQARPDGGEVVAWVDARAAIHDAYQAGVAGTGYSKVVFDLHDKITHPAPAPDVALVVNEIDQELEMFGSGAVAQIATESLRDWRNRLAPFTAAQQEAE